MKIHDPKIIVALDFETRNEVNFFIKRLDPTLCRVKIGNILFTQYGPRLVEELMQAGFEVFLDLKFHDIPQTVAGACRASAALGVWMVNVHVSGGRAMMEAAREALQRAGSPRPYLIGVTVLTSLAKADFDFFGLQRPIEDIVARMAVAAKEAGLDGVVCSAQEAKQLRQNLGEDFILVTPGIRLTEDAQDDQKRIMTPAQAINAGSSYLVVGRSITRAADPKTRLQEISNQIS